MNDSPEHRLAPAIGPGPDELSKDVVAPCLCLHECANCSRHVARGSTRDHAAEIVALADSPVIADEELVD